MRIIITGATGMVGSEVVRQAILDDQITEVTAIVRKPLDLKHPKLKTVIHTDFLNYSSLISVFKNNDACIWCLGISQNQVSKEEYITITYDFTIAAANEMLKANPSIQFVFLSGAGASTDEKSRFLFGRIKGRTENALLQLPFQKLFIARPAGILPVQKIGTYPRLLRLQYRFVKLTGFFLPSYVITSTELAVALLHITKKGAGKTILTHADVKLLAKRK